MSHSRAETDVFRSPAEFSPKLSPTRSPIFTFAATPSNSHWQHNTSRSPAHSSNCQLEESELIGMYKCEVGGELRRNFLKSGPTFHRSPLRTASSNWILRDQREQLLWKGSHRQAQTHYNLKTFFILSKLFSWFLPRTEIFWGVKFVWS